MARALFVALLLVVTACGTSVGGSRPARTSAGTAPAARDSLAGPWAFRNLGRPRTQRVTLSAVLQSRQDTLARVDTLASQTLLEWSVGPQSTPPRVVGMVRDFSIIIGSDSAWRSIPDLAMPVSFIAEQLAADAQPRFVQPADSSCEARAAVVQALRETWLWPPTRVGVGTRWQDSTAYAICRDGVSLNAVSVRDYVVEGAQLREGQLVLRVRRHARTVLHGEGLQFGDSITVSGEGVAEATLELSLDGAAVVSGDGSSQLRLELRGRRRTQQLVQHGALVIRLP
jgi:hypothetical protein